MIGPRFTSACALALLASSVAPAQQATSLPAPRPKLIVTIAVDQLSGDLFDEYRPHFTGGLARLAQGVVFPRGYQSHAATETCPGHSTILTGSRPSRTGIIANSYFDLSTARADKATYCAEDETQPGSSSENYVASPVHLKVPTLGDRMKRANPAARVVSVAGKDRAAIMMGGPTADQTWWWGGKSFVSYKGIAETPLVAQVNAGIARLIGQDRPPMELPDYCAPKAMAFDLGNGKSVGAGQFARAAGDLRAFNISPEKDASTLVLAAALIESLGLGKQTQTDSIAIGLSATDHVGHTYGTEGSEMCLQLSAVDRELGAFFDRLDKSGIDYAVVLTADHGGHDMPERNRAHGAPDAQRVDAALLPATLNQRLSAQLGLPAPLLYADGPFGDFYVSRALTPDQRAKVQAAAVSMIRAHPQVQAVFTAQDLAATPSPSGPPENWSLAQIARASFFPGRSGDFLVLLKPRVTPIADGSRGSVATHGSPWDYDRRVPILFWRKGITPFEQPLGVETVDIMPTLAAQIGLAVPKGEIDGRCLDLDATAGDSCAGQ